MRDTPGDSVTFENYYGTAKSANKVVNEYLVYEKNSQRKNKGVVKTGSKQDVFIISFRNNTDDKDEILGKEYNISIYPNPVDNNLNINYVVENTSKVAINVYDALGRKISNICDGFTEGNQTIQWDLSTISGKKVEHGIYFVHIEINSNSIIKKIIVN